MHQIPDLGAVNSRSLLKQYNSLPAQLWHSRLRALLWRKEAGVPWAAVPAHHLVAHPRANLRSLVHTSAAAVLQTSWPGLMHPASDTPTAPWNPLEWVYSALKTIAIRPWPVAQCAPGLVLLVMKSGYQKEGFKLSLKALSLLSTAPLHKLLLHGGSWPAPSLALSPPLISA